jgi:hypothetical protein
MKTISQFSTLLCPVGLSLLAPLGGDPVHKSLPLSLFSGEPDSRHHSKLKTVFESHFFSSTTLNKTQLYLNHKEIQNLNRPATVKEIEPVILKTTNKQKPNI